MKRRSFLQLGAAAASFASLPRRGRRLGLFPDARAQAAPGTPALLLLFTRGGYNSLFASADSFLANGFFGVNTNNVTDVGSGVYTDKATFGTMPAAAQSHMASIGVNTSITSHSAARSADLHDGMLNSYPLELAAAMGGTAAIKAAQVGNEGLEPPQNTINGVSLQVINDVSSTIAALGGGGNDPTIPDRGIAAKALTAASSLSQARTTASASSLRSMTDGYAASIATLTAPAQSFSYPMMAQAYGLSATTTAVTNFASKLAAAELMITAGANVVVAVDNSGWDTHGDTTGTRVRNMWTALMPAFNTWLTRSLSMPGRNVVTMIMGDFARSYPGSDHANCETVTVIGNTVKQGTTGHMSQTVTLPTGSTPGVQGLWAYIAATLKLPTNPFGTDPHGLIL
jgi:hypothetical protein